MWANSIGGTAADFAIGVKFTTQGWIYIAGFESENTSPPLSHDTHECGSNNTMCKGGCPLGDGYVYTSAGANTKAAVSPVSDLTYLAQVDVASGKSKLVMYSP